MVLSPGHSRGWIVSVLEVLQLGAVGRQVLNTLHTQEGGDDGGAPRPRGNNETRPSPKHVWQMTETCASGRVPLGSCGFNMTASRAAPSNAVVTGHLWLSST